MKPNNRGRRPRFWLIWRESAAITMVRFGGDRTSGSTWVTSRALGLPIRTLFGVDAGLSFEDFDEELSVEAV